MSASQFGNSLEQKTEIKLMIVLSDETVYVVWMIISNLDNYSTELPSLCLRGIGLSG
ncbi:hypothetical protein HMPREF9412_3144 [Paenibacillus sp. HGF5]|nr:hypothetical protein HMPREF9412_3144 [Paenibacillus sp. HGF5]